MARILHVVKWDPAADVVRAVPLLQQYSKHTHHFIAKELHPYQNVYHFPKPLIATDEYAKQTAVFADAILYHHMGFEDTWDFGSKPCAFRNLCIYRDGKEKFWTTLEYNAKTLDRYKLLSSSHWGAQDFLGTDRFRWLPDLIPIHDRNYLPDYSERPPCVSFIKHFDVLSKVNFGPGVQKQDLHAKPLPYVLEQRRKYATVVIDNWSDHHFGLAGMEAVSLGLPTVVFNDKSAVDYLDHAPFFEMHQPILEEAINTVREILDMRLAAPRPQIRRDAELDFDPKMLIERWWEPFFDELLS